MHKLSTFIGITGLIIWTHLRCLSDIPKNLPEPLPLALMELLDTNICVAHVSLALSRNTIRRTREKPLEMVECDGALLKDTFYFRISDADIDASRVPPAEEIYYRLSIRAESKSNFWAWSPSKNIAFERKNAPSNGETPSFFASLSMIKRNRLQTYISPGFLLAVPGTIKWTGSNTFHCEARTDLPLEVTGSILWSATNAYTVTAYCSAKRPAFQGLLWKARVELPGGKESPRTFNAEYEISLPFMWETKLEVEDWRERIEVRAIELADCSKADRDFLPTDLLPNLESASSIGVITNGLRYYLQVDGSLKAVDEPESSGSERRFLRLLLLIPTVLLILTVFAVRGINNNKARSAGDKQTL